MPEFEKHWIGLKGRLNRSVRGDYKDKFAIVWIFVNEPTLDYYFSETGPDEREYRALEKVKPTEDELRERIEVIP